MSVLSPPKSTKETTTAAAPAPASAAVSTHTPARASVQATISVILAVGGAFLAATGLLAAAGAAFGLLAAIFAIGGIRASRQRHITGTGSAVFGFLLGLVALTIGALAVSGALPWFDSGSDNVSRLHHWLENHAAWVTPEV